MAKGSAFERQVCKDLTSWWLQDAAADVCFWRTAGSGGRATFRKRTGKSTTSAHCGDIAAIDERGKPLMDLFTFELKNGYTGATLHALLDDPHPKATKAATWKAWIAQAEQSRIASGSHHWAIIHHRPKRKTVMMVPYEVFTLLADTELDTPAMTLHLDGEHYSTFLYDEFLDGVTPDDIKDILRVENAAKRIKK